MKKLLSIMTSILMVISFAACTSKDKPESQKNQTAKKEESKTKYKDGTYTAQGDKWQFGQEEAIVEIKDNKITSVILKRLDTEGKEVNYEDWKGEKDASGKLHPNLKQYRMDIANKIIEKQSAEVDTISGATVSTKNWKIATQRALDKAKQ